jgi:hypothetical protein
MLKDPPLLRDTPHFFPHRFRRPQRAIRDHRCARVRGHKNTAVRKSPVSCRLRPLACISSIRARSTAPNTTVSHTVAPGPSQPDPHHLHGGRIGEPDQRPADHRAGCEHILCAVRPDQFHVFHAIAYAAVRRPPAWARMPWSDNSRMAARRFARSVAVVRSMALLTIRVRPA